MLLCSAASSRLGLGDNNKRELESEKRRRRRGRAPSIHPRTLLSRKHRPGRGYVCVRVCAGGLVRDPKKGPGNATIFTRVARYQTPKETRDRTNTRPPAAWPCQGCFLRTHAWTFSCAASCFGASTGEELRRRRLSNVQRLGGRRGSLGTRADARVRNR